MILVTGATGTVGSEVTQQLVEAGQRPRLFVRNLSKAARWREQAELFQGDLAEPAVLERAMKGIEKVFLLASGTNQVVEESNVVEAAKKARVKHIVKLSVIGAEHQAILIQKWHRQGEQKIEASGIPHTFLRPGNFMSNTLMSADSIKREGAFYLPAGNGKIAPIAPADIAAVAVRVFLDPGHAGKAYTLTGPEALSFSEQAGMLSKLIGKQVKYVAVSPDQARSSMLAAGMPEVYVGALLELYAMIREGQAALVTNTVQQVLGRKPTTLDEWFRQNASTFGS